MQAMHTRNDLALRARDARQHDLGRGELGALLFGFRLRLALLLRTLAL